MDTTTTTTRRSRFLMDDLLSYRQNPNSSISSSSSSSSSLTTRPQQQQQQPASASSSDAIHQADGDTLIGHFIAGCFLLGFGCFFMGLTLLRLRKIKLKLITNHHHHHHYYDDDLDDDDDDNDNIDIIMKRRRRVVGYEENEDEEEELDDLLFITKRLQIHVDNDNDHDEEDIIISRSTEHESTEKKNAVRHGSINNESSLSNNNNTTEIIEDTGNNDDDENGIVELTKDNNTYDNNRSHHQYYLDDIDDQHQQDLTTISQIYCYQHLPESSTSKLILCTSIALITSTIFGLLLESVGGIYINYNDHPDYTLFSYALHETVTLLFLMVGITGLVEYYGKLPTDSIRVALSIAFGGEALLWYIHSTTKLDSTTSLIHKLLSFLGLLTSITILISILLSSSSPFGIKKNRYNNYNSRRRQRITNQRHHGDDDQRYRDNMSYPITSLIIHILSLTLIIWQGLWFVLAGKHSQTPIQQPDLVPCYFILQGIMLWSIIQTIFCCCL